MKKLTFFSFILFSTSCFSQIDYRSCSKIVGEKNDSFSIDENSKLVIPKAFSIRSQNSSDLKDEFELIRTKNKSTLRLQFKKDASGKISKIITGPLEASKQLIKNNTDERVGIEADLEFVENRCYLKLVRGRTYFADNKEISYEEGVAREDCLEVLKLNDQCDKGKLRCSDEVERMSSEKLRKMTSQIQLLQGPDWKLFFSDGIMKGSDAFVRIFNLMFACGDKFYLREKEPELKNNPKEAIKI